MMILKYDDTLVNKKNHQNHDFWDGVFDVDFVDDSFDVFVDGLQDALPSPYNVKLARYGLLTIFQTGLRNFYEWILPFCLRRPQAPPEPDLVWSRSPARTITIGWTLSREWLHTNNSFHMTCRM